MKIHGMIIRAIGFWLLAVAYPLCAQTITVQGQSGGSVNVSVSPSSSAVVLDGKLCVVADVEYTFTLTPTNPEGAGWTVVNGGPVTNSFTPQQAGGPAVPIQESSARFKFVRNRPGMAEEESPVTISVTVLKVDVDVDDTTSTTDDVVLLKSTAPTVVYHTTKVRARLLPSLNATLGIYLVPGSDGRLALSAATTGFSNSLLLTLPVSSGYSNFYLGGESLSAASGDAKLEARLNSSTGQLISNKTATVFSFNDAHVNVTAGGNYSLFSSGIGYKKFAVSGGPAVSLSARATLAPAGLSPTAAPYNRYRVGLLQNIHSVLSSVFIQYRIKDVAWVSGVDPGVTITPAKFLWHRLDYPNKMIDAPNATSSVGNGTYLATSNTAAANGSSVTSSDNPQFTMPDLLQRAAVASPGGPVVATVNYELDFCSTSDSFSTFCVVLNTDTSKVIPYKQSLWTTSAVSINNPVGSATVSGNDGVVAIADIVLEGVTANDYALVSSNYIYYYTGSPTTQSIPRP